MAWSVLQSASNSNSGGTTVAATFSTANLSTGSKIIAYVEASVATGGGAYFTGATDGTNSLTALYNNSGAGNGNAIAMYAMDTPAGDVGTKPTITVTANTALATNFGLALLIQEVSGLLAGNTTAMLDGSIAENDGNSASATTGAYSSTAASEYLVAVYGDQGISVTFTSFPSGYTEDPSSIMGQSTANIAVGYKNSSNGAESATFGLSGSGLWITMIGAFQLGGPVITSGPKLSPQPMGSQPAMIVSAAGWRGAQHSR